MGRRTSEIVAGLFFLAVGLLFILYSGRRARRLTEQHRGLMSDPYAEKVMRIGHIIIGLLFVAMGLLAMLGEEMWR